ncbi:restriction endonuclease subunit S [Sulfurimonas sp. SWIR-19]|uniref:restriction endonuclease subunit S n=1 Tax=Sulfurimonas sp. SWIR-19 TaxID=2878390 RepID=UPI001CF23893|nr:restriction endonuclease subunit S [Sulfurimonas sp. SWIR-19]UCN00156.1 restriction endonuclease subunit S [Sulfurimonas sp. SWIR-19]
MSSRVTIKELLEGVEVEWKQLGEVANYEQPTQYLVKSKNYSDDFDTPVLTAGKTFILGYTDEVGGIYRASESPVIIFDDFTTANKWVDFDFKAKSSAMKMITSKDDSEVLLKYIYYWLNILPSDLIDGDHKRQWISNFAKKLIPIPSLDAQSEIVRVLDNFTELTAELTAELSARKKQYSYYRDKLLRFEEDEVEWKKLGDLCSIGVGQAPKGIGEGKYSFINAGTTPSGYLNEYNTEPETITTPSRGQGGIGYVAYQSSPFWCGPLCYRICSINQSVTTRFIYYIMSNRVKDIIELANMAGVPALNKKALSEFLVPIPYPNNPKKSLEKQKEIVDILDKFDTLTNSMNKGLPREIELREKQYEYYRDLLLTFPKSEVER